MRAAALPTIESRIFTGSLRRSGFLGLEAPARGHLEELRGLGADADLRDGRDRLLRLAEDAHPGTGLEGKAGQLAHRGHETAEGLRRTRPLEEVCEDARP